MGFDALSPDGDRMRLFKTVRPEPVEGHSKSN
jgi:hypothetical protein